jgi:hypothetical protein
MRSSSAYRVEAIVGPDNLQTAYQLGFLARCGPGMYGVTEETTAVDCTIVERIAVDRKDGNVCKLDHHTPVKAAGWYLRAWTRWAKQHAVCCRAA